MTGSFHFTHSVGVLSAYIASCSTDLAYPKSEDFCDGMMVSLSMRSITSARMFVAVGQGANDGSVPSTVSASWYVTSGAEMFSADAPALVHLAEYGCG